MRCMSFRPYNNKWRKVQNMKRLLCIISGMNAGGAETFLMKIYRKIDRTQYQFDFCINVIEKCYYEDEIELLGGKIYRIPSKSENPKEFKKQLSALISNKKYKYVLRITSNAMGFWDMKIAKKAGAKRCCVRSSNSSDGISLGMKMAHCLGRFFLSKYVDVAIAPSDLAAKYTFGKNAYESGAVEILNNALDLDVYSYNKEGRKRIREEFQILENEFVVGHVGRFETQKNHMFLIEVFKEILKTNPNAKLLLVGIGSKENEIKKQIAEYGIGNNVIFAGLRTDIVDLLSAMDVFVFPSFYEGMPNVIIEAQAVGVPCIISDTITRDANITGLVTYVSLAKNPTDWAETVKNITVKDKICTKSFFIEKKYDIDTVAKQFINIIFE